MCNGLRTARPDCPSFIVSGVLLIIELTSVPSNYMNVTEPREVTGPALAHVTSHTAHAREGWAASISHSAAAETELPVQPMHVVLSSSFLTYAGLSPALVQLVHLLPRRLGPACVATMASMPSQPPPVPPPPPAPALPSLAPPMERSAPDTCPECGGDDVIEDWRQGNSVCRSCGLVVAANLVDVGSEWRTFSNEEGDDPNRVGGPMNPLLESGPTTLISKGGGAGGMNQSLNRAQNRNAISAADKFLIEVFGRVGRLAERSHMSGGVRDRANEMFKRYYDVLTLKEGGVRSRALKEEETAGIVAACLFLAARNEGAPRTFKEVCAVSQVPKKEIGVRMKAIERALEDVRSGVVRGSEDFVGRYCSLLNLGRTVVNDANEVATGARECEGVYGKTYVSLAAAAIFVVCQLPEVAEGTPPPTAGSEKKPPTGKEPKVGEKRGRDATAMASVAGGGPGVNPENTRYRTAKEIAAVAGVAEVTIRVTYKAMLPHLARVLPVRYRRADIIGGLPSP